MNAVNVKVDRRLLHQLLEIPAQYEIVNSSMDNKDGAIVFTLSGSGLPEAKCMCEIKNAELVVTHIAELKVGD